MTSLEQYKKIEKQKLMEKQKLEGQILGKYDFGDSDDSIIQI